MIDLPFIQYFYESSAKRMIDRLVTRIERALTDGVTQRGEATLVTSGGLTPMPLLEALGRRPIAWPAVTVTLTDERCVPLYDPQSNAAMVRRSLMRDAAASRTRLVPLHGDGPEETVQPETAAKRLSSVPRPFDFVLLGMGQDGHIASLFPGQASPALGLNPIGSTDAVTASAGDTLRVSLTLSALLDARNVALLIMGSAKRRVLEEASASADADAFELPVRALLSQRRTPFEIHWAPTQEAE